jgi:hypothetical protein
MRALGASRTSLAPGGALAGGWARNPLWKTARAVPSLDLRFADNKTLGDAYGGGSPVTFTRASSGTYVGSDGLIKSATTNEPRFDHNPTTGESLGLLVEEARTNLLTYSEQFDNAGWIKFGSAITANESTAPDGTTTADLWTNSSSPGAVSQNYTKDGTARTYSGSVWVKSSVTAFTLSVDDGTNTNRGRAVFDIATGVLTTVVNDGVFTNTSGTITAYPNSWYRVTITTTTSTVTTVRLRSFFSNIGATARIWGAQLEENAAFATSYISTTTATVTRAADVASITGAAFSSFYNQTEGTVFADIAVAQPVTGGNQFAFRTSDNGYNNAIAINIPGQAQLSTASGGTFDGSASSVASLVANVSAKIGAAYASNNLGLSLNGATAVTDTSATMPTTLNRADIGSDHAGLNRVKACTIKRLTYWPVRLSNTTLQQITQP